jgi:hypothetical protein
MNILKMYGDKDLLKHLGHLDSEKDFYGVLFLLLYHLTVGIFCFHANTRFASKCESPYPYMYIYKLSLTYGEIKVIGVRIIIDTKELCTYYIFYKGFTYSINLANLTKLDFMCRVADLRWLKAFEPFMGYVKKALEAKGFHV